MSERRVVIRDAQFWGLDAIAGLNTDTEPPDSFVSNGVRYRCIHINARYVHYEAQPAPVMPASWEPFTDVPNT